MNRIDRLMAINLVLQGSRVARAEDIARRFEVSLRTVYRDLAALSEAGVPIVAEAGIGYSLMRGYRLPPIMFTAGEASALATAGLTARHTGDASLSDSIESALLKVKAVLPDEQKAGLERLEKSLAIGFANRTEPVSSENLVDLQMALAERRVLKLVYESGGRGERTMREVEPIGLVHYLEKWHLIAWCRLRKDSRDFRIDRIRKMDIMEEKIEKPKMASLQEFLEKERRLETPVHVRIWFHRQVSERAKRQWSLGLIDEEDEGEGSILTLATGDLEWMVGWILSFGNRARVIEPGELRSKLADEAKRLTKHHSEK